MSGGTAIFTADRASLTEIDQALKHAEAVVVLWSEASLGSAWVQDEAAEGRDSDRLVPAMIDPVVRRSAFANTRPSTCPT